MSLPNTVSTDTLSPTSGPDMVAARRAMIDSQLRTSGVNTPFVLSRMSAVPRENHVPEELASVAYSDRSIRVGDGARLAAPLFYGKLLEEAAPRLDDRVLLVSAVPGYLEELIAPLVAEIVTLEPDKAAGSPRLKGPFSLLLIDGAVENVPARLVKAMSDDGRAVLGVIESGVTRLATARRSGDGLAMLPLAELGIPHLPAFDRPPVWQF